MTDITIKGLKQLRKKVSEYDKLLFKKFKMYKIIGYNIFYYKRKGVVNKNE